MDASGVGEAAAVVPSQRTAPAAGPDVLRSLGLEALVELIESSDYGVCITGDDHTWTYLNPAAARLVGRPFPELAGEDYLLSFPEHERPGLLALERDQREGDTGFYTNTIVQPDGTEVEMTWSGTVLTVDGQELAPAIFHETAGVRQAEREAAVLGAAAARIAAGSSSREVLDTLAEEVVAGSRAVGCLVLVGSGPDGRLVAAGRAGVPAEVEARLADARLRLADLPGADVLLGGRVLLLSDDRTRLRGAPATATLVEPVTEAGWEGSAKVPLLRGGEVAGCLVAFLPPEVTAPTEAELAFWSAIGAQASVALTTDELRGQAAAQAAELERQRLGRDLHDSVSSALFSLHTRAQAVTRALAADDRDVLAAAAADIEALSRQAITEMRAMLTELRPATIAGTDRLAAALQQLARTATRDGLPVQLQATPQVLPLEPSTGEHLRRIAAEALHNSVKHGGARSATVELEVRGSELVLAVSDDGCGFDPAAVPADRHGQRTMRERAVLCGGWLHVDSAPGQGTRVVARVPLPG